MNLPTLCVVEDDSLSARITAMRLQEMGYSVQPVCTSYEQALARLDAEAPALFLLDVFFQQLPQGLQLASRLKSLGIPFIFVSGLGDLEFAPQIKELKPAAFLTKPASLLSLTVAIDAALSTRQQSAAMQTTAPSQAVFLKDGYQHKRVLLSEILFLDHEHNYVAFHLSNGRKILQRGTLGTALEQMNCDRFVRLGRSLVVNLDAITTLGHQKMEIQQREFRISAQQYAMLAQRLCLG